MAYIFSSEHKKRFKKQVEQNSWTTMNPANSVKKNKIIHGLNIELYTENTPEDKALTSKKEAALKDSIKRIQDSGIMFTDADVKKFRVVCYGATSTVPSRGAVYFENITDLKPCILLQLGNRVSKHVTVDKSVSQSMPNSQSVSVVVAGGVRVRPPRVVADRIYDYYKPTKTVSAKEKCVIAQTLHELGHIIHQLNSPDDYWLNADVAGGKNQLAVIQRKLEFKAIKDYGLKYVSHYAGTDGKSLNEYVAEVFCGILMGIPWDAIDTSGKLMQTYVSLGGPVPTVIPEPISRLTDFVDASCNCTENDHGEAFKYW